MGTSLNKRYLLLGFLIFFLTGCKQQLYTALSERDANEMIAVLAARNLNAEKVTNDKGDFRIELSRSDFSAAVEALRDHGLPRPKFSSIGEVFKKEGLVTTANAERLRFMFAMSEELSKTLSLIDGVVEARVHPVLPGGDPLTDKLTPASASIFIKHTPDANLTMLAPTIKDLVCASIEGLTYDKVSLTFVPATKMLVPGASTPIQTTTIEANNLFSLPALGIGLTAGFLVMGIGLVAMRPREKYESDSQQSSDQNTGATSPRTVQSKQFNPLWSSILQRLRGIKNNKRLPAGTPRSSLHPVAQESTSGRRPVNPEGKPAAPVSNDSFK